MTQKKPISLKNETKQEKHQKTAAKAWSTTAYLGDNSYRELIYRTNRAPADPNQEPAGSSCSSSSAKQAIGWCRPPRKTSNRLVPPTAQTHASFQLGQSRSESKQYIKRQPKTWPWGCFTGLLLLRNQR